MFSYMRGVVQHVDDQMLSIEVGGIGWQVLVANPALFTVHKEAVIFIHMQWNQEQGPTLYGFMQQQEKAVFLLIISCSGIGPKIALLILEKLSPSAFLRAVQTADIKTLSSISGIGPKKAEQLIVQLKHKVSALLDKGWQHAQDAQGQQIEQWQNIVQVLQSLHYSAGEIDQALAHVAKESKNTSVAFDALLRKALSFLAKKV